VVLVEAPQPDSPYGIKGIGEIGLVPTAGAVAAAFHEVDGRWRTRPPVQPAPAARVGMSGASRRAGVRPPPHLLRPRPRDALTAEDTDHVRGDPRTDLVASRHGTRPRDDRVVGEARRTGSPRGGDHDDHRSSREPQRHRGEPVGHRRPPPRGGVRVLPAYGVTDRHGPDGARRGLEENRRFLSEGGRGWVGIHAAFTCEDDTIEEAAGLAEDLGVGVHVHVHEGPEDEGAAIGWPATVVPTGCSPTACTCHRPRLAKGTVLHNPASNLNNAVGYADPRRFAIPWRSEPTGSDRGHARHVPARLLPASVRRRDRLAGDGLVVVGDWVEPRARSASRQSVVVLRADGAVASGIHSGPRPSRSRWTAPSCGTRARPPGSTRRDQGEAPPNRPPGCTPDCEEEPMNAPPLTPFPLVCCWEGSPTSGRRVTASSTSPSPASGRRNPMST
jgi:hypothetical protein